MPSNIASKNLKFLKTAYFPNFLKNGAKLMDALCSLVADLQTDRDVTVNRFLEHAGSEDFIWAILKLLGFTNEKIAGNAAYVVGTLADTSSGSERLVSLVGKSPETGNRVLNDLMRLLSFDDEEIVLNGVGALGSLADSEPGRQWICSASQYNLLLEKICSLLRHKNVWIGSNSALLLARLTILDGGLSQMLVHSNAREICINLVLSLGSDAAGRGMNAAFALGRIADVAGGQELIAVLEDDLHKIMVKQLSKMFEDRDVGTAKNALYALSCLAGQKHGSTILARNKIIEQIAKHLCDMLLNELADNELRWFCAMTLRSFACQQKTCLELKRLHFVYNSCKAALRMTTMAEDIKDEIIDVFEFLKPLPQCSPPRVELTGPLTIKIEWNESKLRGPFQARYGLFHSTDHGEPVQIYGGSDLKFLVTDLKAYTIHTFRLRLVTDHEEGPLSDAVSIRTEEWLPGQVRNLHMVANTASQIKVAWDEPLDPNGIIRHYVIYLDDNPKQVGRTEENYFILQNLNQTGEKDKGIYTVHVAAVTGRGEGLRLSLEVCTAEVGESRPSKPVITVLGRTELYVTWNAPPNAPGKIIRYELLANGEIVYSGTELYATVTRLQPENEYSFQVVLFSNEGRFQSLVSKKTTPRDEFIAFSGPRSASSSSRSRRSARSGLRKSATAAEVQTTTEEITLNCVPPAPEPVSAPPTNPPTPPPKSFRRSKTMISSSSTRKPSSLRRIAKSSTRRSIPAIHSSNKDAVSSSQSLPTVNKGENKESQVEGANDVVTTNVSNCVKRERSNTTGSKGSDTIKDAAVNAARQLRRDRSLSVVHKLLSSGINRASSSSQHGDSNKATSNNNNNNNNSSDIRCSIVTLNLPSDVPNAFDLNTNRWAHSLGLHRSDTSNNMISATNQPPTTADSSRNNRINNAAPMPSSDRRFAVASTVQSYFGNNSNFNSNFNHYYRSSVLTSSLSAVIDANNNNNNNKEPQQPQECLPLPVSRGSERLLPGDILRYHLPSNCSPPRLYAIHNKPSQSRQSMTRLMRSRYSLTSLLSPQQQQHQQQPQSQPSATN